MNNFCKLLLVIVAGVFSPICKSFDQCTNPTQGKADENTRYGFSAFGIWNEEWTTSQVSDLVGKRDFIVEWCVSESGKRNEFTLRYHPLNTAKTYSDCKNAIDTATRPAGIIIANVSSYVIGEMYDLKTDKKIDVIKYSGPVITTYRGGIIIEYICNDGNWLSRVFH